MSYSYRFHPLTAQDYNEAYAWYEGKSKGLGERFLEMVRKKLDEITKNPKSFGSRSKRSFREARVDFFPFVIVYKINNRKKEVYISSIHHERKHPQSKYRK